MARERQIRDRVERCSPERGCDAAALTCFEGPCSRCRARVRVCPDATARCRARKVWRDQTIRLDRCVPARLVENPAGKSALAKIGGAPTVARAHTTSAHRPRLRPTPERANNAPNSARDGDRRRDANGDRGAAPSAPRTPRNRRRCRHRHARRPPCLARLSRPPAGRVRDEALGRRDARLAHGRRVRRRGRRDGRERGRGEARERVGERRRASAGTGREQQVGGIPRAKGAAVPSVRGRRARRSRRLVRRRRVRRRRVRSRARRVPSARARRRDDDDVDVSRIIPSHRARGRRRPCRRRRRARDRTRSSSAVDASARTSRARCAEEGRWRRW